MLMKKESLSNQDVSEKGDGYFLDNGETNVIVPDLSVIVEGLVSEWLASKKNGGYKLVIHRALLTYLERESRENRAVGFLGISELEVLRKRAEEGAIRMDYSGEDIRGYELERITSDDVNRMIRILAYETNGILMTADDIQERLARIKGLHVVALEKKILRKKLSLEKFFDKETMSVHLKEGTPPFAKRGFPGSWKFVQIADSKLSQKSVQHIGREIIEEANIRKDSFIEIERPGSTIVQLGSFRIVITKPPFSDGWEVTAVRPVKRLALEDYSLSEKLISRINDRAEGILIAGSPGMGKSTFAQALAEHYVKKGKIIKTIEAPRDLILSDEITQYAISHGDAQEVHDILLLSRPDYTIFDEMRNTSDFQLFSDLRLAGIGLAGVVHATNPIDAIQRFVGRIELGVIPQVIDTVIFINKGQVSKVLSLNMTVKVPSGMTEADLARPVVAVTDFESEKLEYELYSYGEETVVVPVSSGRSRSPASKLAEKKLEEEIKSYEPDARVELLSENKAVVYVPESRISRMIGRGGRNIEMIEKRVGISIDVQPLNESRGEKKEEAPFTSKIGKNSITLFLDSKYSDMDADIFLDGDYLLTARIGRRGTIKITRKNKIGKLITDALNVGGKLVVKV